MKKKFKEFDIFKVCKDNNGAHTHDVNQKKMIVNHLVSPKAETTDCLVFTAFFTVTNFTSSLKYIFDCRISQHIIYLFNNVLFSSDKYFFI